MSCTGGKFDLIKIPMVTLIDTLDTLVILGNYSGEQKWMFMCHFIRA